MNIPRATYAAVSSRLSLLACLVIPGLAALGMVPLFVVCLPLGIFVRDYFGGDFGMAMSIALMLPFIVLPFLLPVAALNLIDRRIGIRCPKCNVSLTTGCMPEKVLITRQCSHCKSVVLLDDEYGSAERKTRPWLLLTLTALAVLGIIVAVILRISLPQPPATDLKSEVLTLAALFGGVMFIQTMHTAIMSILKRHWQRQANRAEPGTESIE